MESFEIYECVMCGEILGYNGRFCSDECVNEYYYVNRTCSTCGGEFWDGGTSCDCEDWEDDAPQGFEFDDDDTNVEDFTTDEDLPF